jgi:hemolysin activation/secretion protein
MGDLVTGNLLHTQGTDYGRLGFTAPVGAAGWRVGANASLLSYKILTEFSASNLTGTSDTQGLEASYPLIRSRLKNLFLNLNYDSKHFDNKSTQATESHYSVDSTTIALNGNLFDNLGGGGATNSSVALILGNVALGTLDQGETASLNGSFSKLRYALSRQQVITDNVYLYVNLSGQQSNKNLDSSEKIYLGGVNGVRAYPSNEGGGSSGNVANVELRWQLPWDMSITGFYDVGHISNYGGSPSYSLQGGGLSLARHFANGANIKGTWAHRIGDNPNPTSTGNDQDGSLQKNRFWLTAGVPF